MTKDHKKEAIEFLTDIRAGNSTDDLSNTFRFTFINGLSNLLKHIAREALEEAAKESERHGCSMSMRG